MHNADSKAPLRQHVVAGKSQLDDYREPSGRRDLLEYLAG